MAREIANMSRRDKRTPWRDVGMERVQANGSRRGKRIWRNVGMERERRPTPT